MKLYPYQKIGVEFLKHHKFALLADDCGLGKSAQAIELINQVPEIQSVLIICPAFLKLNWKNELTKWLKRDMNVQIINAKNEIEFETDIIVINYNILERFKLLYYKRFDLLVCDEAHYLGGRKSKRTTNVKLISRRAKRRLLMTGTPIQNKTISLYPLLNILDPKTWSSYYDFAFRYCGAFKSRWGLDVSGTSNSKELNKRMQKFMIRRMKKEVLPDLPSKTRQIIEIDINHKENKAVKELKYLMDISDSNEQILFEEIALIRHETAKLKIPITIKHLKNIDKKCLVFGYHKDVLEELHSNFPNSALITGDTNMKKRQKHVEAFQSDPAIQFLFGNMNACGVGLNLTAAELVVFVELSWSPQDITQAEDRAVRIGQKNNVLIQHIVAKDSIEARLAKAIVKKQHNNFNILDKKEIMRVIR